VGNILVFLKLPSWLFLLAFALIDLMNIKSWRPQPASYLVNGDGNATGKSIIYLFMHRTRSFSIAPRRNPFSHSVAAVRIKPSETSKIIASVILRTVRDPLVCIISGFVISERLSDTDANHCPWLA